MELNVRQPNVWMIFSKRTFDEDSLEEKQEVDPRASLAQVRALSLTLLLVQKLRKLFVVEIGLGCGKLVFGPDQNPGVHDLDWHIRSGDLSNHKRGKRYGTGLLIKQVCRVRWRDWERRGETEGRTGG
jgi:hypothetical protein